MHIKFKKYIPIAFQFFKFGIIGFLNAIIDFSIYIALTRNFDFWNKYFLITNIISFISANMFSFFMNKKITFKDTNNSNLTKKYIKFLLITIASLIITELCLFIGVKFLFISDLYAKIVGVILGAIWNFTMYKISIFNKN